MGTPEVAWPNPRRRRGNVRDGSSRRLETGRAAPDPGVRGLHREPAPLVFGISHGRRKQSGDKLVDFAYLGVLFRSVNPYFFAALGIAAAIGFSVLGAAWGIFITGSSLVGAA